MPELPEVETTLRGVLPHVLGHTVSAAVVREPRLRWPITPGLGAEIAGQRIDAVQRRAKYLLFRTRRGTLLVHLGMSGSLRVLRDPCPPGPPRALRPDVRERQPAALLRSAPLRRRPMDGRRP